VLVVGQIAEPKALDPHAVTAVNDFRILMNVYDGLVRYASGTLEVEPALATAGRSPTTAPSTPSPCARA
jgi:peptide/nickel transport system substrate-binding protein